MEGIMNKWKFNVALDALAIAGAVSAQDSTMSFFITSSGAGNGADLGGLAGADAHCQSLATAAGAGNKTWHAYLSVGASGGKPAVNARDRIGSGPWFNARGVQIAASLDDLHSENAKTGKEGSLTETGEIVNGRGDTPNRHDILSGSLLDGTAFPEDGMDHTCSAWTSSAEDGSAQVGHHDRQGGGQNPNSFNSAHASRGCSQPNLQATGGDGLFYCFAID
ncbi:MAG: hypothetical protein H6978_02730 [Gammaproteobacteria bacterium]|nr:hypothetical protein [Gammaproteobacteria bacterium]